MNSTATKGYADLIELAATWCDAEAASRGAAGTYLWANRARMLRDGYKPLLVSAVSETTLHWEKWDDSEPFDHSIVWWTDGTSLALGSINEDSQPWFILGISGPKCSDMKPTHYAKFTAPELPK